MSWSLFELTLDVEQIFGKLATLQLLELKRVNLIWKHGHLKQLTILLGSNKSSFD